MWQYRSFYDQVIDVGFLNQSAFQPFLQVWNQCLQCEFPLRIETQPKYYHCRTYSLRVYHRAEIHAHARTILRVIPLPGLTHGMQ